MSIESNLVALTIAVENLTKAIHQNTQAANAVMQPAAAPFVPAATDNDDGVTLARESSVVADEQAPVAKRTRRTAAKKAELEAAAVATPVEPAAPVNEQIPLFDDEPEPARVITLNDVRSAILSFRDRHGVNAARELLVKHGAETLQAINPDNFSALIEDCAK